MNYMFPIFILMQKDSYFKIMIPLNNLKRFYGKRENMKPNLLYILFQGERNTENFLFCFYRLLYYYSYEKLKIVKVRKYECRKHIQFYEHFSGKI